ncbi:hypothetical protein LCGC14_2405320 [marine sediment metagenome]|uniref:Uncharacterized protein n=1 Tax=marine sediment metagenome TaxID=412755 RepID=A0A0F9BU28_9ZZZZ
MVSGDLTITDGKFTWTNASDEAAGRKVSMMKLLASDHTFTVESDIYKLLMRRYKKYMGQLRDAVIIEKMEFKEKLEKAEKVEIDPESTDKRADK